LIVERGIHVPQRQNLVGQIVPEVVEQIIAQGLHRLVVESIDILQRIVAAKCRVKVFDHKPENIRQAERRRVRSDQLID